jgi:hypothetical protein
MPCSLTHFRTTRLSSSVRLGIPVGIKHRSSGIHSCLANHGEWTEFDETRDAPARVQHDINGREVPLDQFSSGTRAFREQAFELEPRALYRAHLGDDAAIPYRRVTPRSNAV